MLQETETLENEEPIIEEAPKEATQEIAKEESTIAADQETTEPQAGSEDIQDGSSKDYRERQRYQRKIEGYKKKSQELEDAAKKLAEENSVLRQYVDNYGQAASYHYGDKIKLKINEAQLKLEEAETNDDVKAKAAAIRELTKLAEEEAYLERYNYNNRAATEQNKSAAPTQPAVNQPSNQQDVDLPEEIEDWFDEHPWLDQRRKEFNPDMRDEIYAYSQNLAKKWERLGKINQIDSPEFLNELSKYARDNFQEYYSPTNRRPPLNNNRGITQPPIKKQPTTQSSPRFTDDERDMMKSFNMTQEEWIEYKKEVEKRSQGIR